MILSCAVKVLRFASARVEHGQVWSFIICRAWLPGLKRFIPRARQDGDISSSRAPVVGCQ
jgi:hypothetical protein